MMVLKLFHLKNIKYLAFFLCFLGKFLGIPYSINIMVFFTAIFIFSYFFQGVNKWQDVNKLFLLPIIFFLYHLISLFYSDNKNVAWFDIEVKLSFIIIPILFALEKNEFKIEFPKIIRIYLFTSGLMSLAFLLKMLIHFLKTGNLLLYMEFSSPLHPSYLVLFLTVNILFILWQWIFEKKFDKLSIFSFIFTMPMFYFAESKAGIIALIGMFIFMIFKAIYFKNKVLSITIVSSTLILFTIFATQNYRFKALIGSVFNYHEIFEHPEKVKESTALRLLAWDASLDVVKKYPIFGVGAGDIKTELEKVYREKNYVKPLEMKMNSHNQFFETTVGQGIIGLSLLILMFFLPLFFKSDYMVIYQGFLIIVIINLLFESMFNRQSGVVFITLIYCLLISPKTNSVKQSLDNNSLK